MKQLDGRDDRQQHGCEVHCQWSLLAMDKLRYHVASLAASVAKGAPEAVGQRCGDVAHQHHQHHHQRVKTPVQI